MKLEKITFRNRQGHELSAKLELPKISPIVGYALFAHCFTCNKNLTAVRNISRALTKNGIAVLRFDFTGLGESEGDFENTNFSSNVEDLEDMAAYMKEHYEPPSILIGHSLGGAAVIFAATRLSFVKAVVTIGAPAHPEHVTHLLKDGIHQILKEGEALVDIGGREFRVKKQFLEDIQDKNMARSIQEMKKPLLVMHSPQDMTVPIENAARIYQAGRHPKSFISLDGADHLLSNKKDSQYAGQIIAAWAHKYLTQKTILSHENL